MTTATVCANRITESALVNGREGMSAKTQAVASQSIGCGGSRATNVAPYGGHDIPAPVGLKRVPMLLSRWRSNSPRHSRTS